MVDPSIGRCAEYLLEVRAEEIPARMLAPAMQQLATRLFEELMGRGLGPAEIETGFTPRRLALVLRDLPAAERDTVETLQGPPARAAWDSEGRPTKALEGFASRLGVPVEAVERLATERGEYASARREINGRPLAEVLSELVPRLLSEISWAKSMKWLDATGPWVRPLHGIVSLLDGEVVPFSLFGVSAGNISVGHPILSPEPFEVKNAQGWRKELTKRHIEVSFEARRATIAAKLNAAADASEGEVATDAELLDKLAAICEIPGVVAGSLDPEFLALPREVLATSLRDHQSAFTVEHDGKLLPMFLTVMDRPDDPEGRVSLGNSWVVAARLQDAQFFYGEDHKSSLASKAERLSKLTFHEKLGSYEAKAQRLEALAGWLCDTLGWEGEKPAAVLAARLAKADLTTEMVKEFTSLQGVMGGIYAREDGAEEACWQAIGDHYLPASVDDPLPRGRAGLVVALADRLDTLVGIFALGMVPSGSKDPFGLRRAAQGVVRILVESRIGLDPLAAAARALEGYAGVKLIKPADEVLAQLDVFFRDRLRYVLGREGLAWDEIEAGLAVGASDLPNLRARVAAVHELRGEAALAALVSLSKRVSNILKDSSPGLVDPDRLSEEAEQELHRVTGEVSSEMAAASSAADPARALRSALVLAAPLDRFFVDVMVMAEDPAVRATRLALLGEVRRVLTAVADLGQIQLDGKAT